jgi:predicted nucleic acid-binding protein
MKALLDTSVLIAGMLPDHAHHASAFPWLRRGKAGAYRVVVSGHSLAEVYAVLTRMPRTPQIQPSEAFQMIEENVARVCEIQTFDPGDYVELLREIHPHGVVGGMVYDALIARAAEKANVDYLVTLNDKHFHKVWPAGGNRIVSPLSLAAP